MRGRKPIYQPNRLEIGQRIQLKQKNAAFARQYASKWSNKYKPKAFGYYTENNKTFIERTL